MTLTVRTLSVHAIAPARLSQMRRAGHDGHGNALNTFAAVGEGEPLRCCLRYAAPGEQIMLISFAPFEHASVWTEVGPVYVHALACPGYTPTGHLPEQLSRGPRVLRTYAPDRSMNYAHNTVVVDDSDLEPVIAKLLATAGVALVHVRTLAPQCFLYEVAAAR